MGVGNLFVATVVLILVLFIISYLHGRK